MQSTSLFFVMILSIATCGCLAVEGRPHSVDPNEVHDQTWKNQKHGTDEQEILNAQFIGYRNNCIPQGEGCLCAVGTESDTGLEVDQVRTTDAECKCRQGEKGKDCPPNAPN